MDNQLVIYKSEDNSIKVEVNVQAESVWLTVDQLAQLFQRDRSVIQRHIRNIFNEGELQQGASTCANFAQVQLEGGRKVSRQIPFYNLDVIISVGYRVKSQQGTRFRLWANQILKQYLLDGYAVNQDRMKQLNIAVQIMKRANNQLDSKQILDVVEAYSIALNLLDDYDHDSIQKPCGTEATYKITYEECRQIIDNMSFGSESELFGNEKDESFRSSIGAIYQTYDAVELYPSLEEKASNLLYFVTKNHSFTDGNKRIAAALFLYFLNKNQALFINDEKIIEDHTLVALVIMIAESRPEEKETIVKLIMKFLKSDR